MLTDSRTQVRLSEIVWATDFSTSSETALRYAVAIARRYDSRLLLTHVIPPEPAHALPPDAMIHTYELSRQHAEEQMGQLLVSGMLRPISHQVLLAESEIWRTLAQIVKEHKVDLIVVGTHGRTGIRKLLLGSVAEEIFRLASCPVLTVGPHAPGLVREDAELQHILYATDFSPASERAAEYALSLAQEHQAKLAILHVVKESTEVSARNRELMRSYFEHRVETLLSPDAAQWCTPELLMEEGDSAEKILRVAEKQRADLIVLGVRRSASFPGHLPPTTAYRVVCQAHCPVLTVRS